EHVKQPNAARMQKHVRQMETRRLQTMNGCIELERPPGQGMPVRGVRCRKRPASIGPAQPLTDLGKLRDILRIIVVEKLAMECASEYAQCDDKQSRPRALSEEFIHGLQLIASYFLADGADTDELRPTRRQSKRVFSRKTFSKRPLFWAAPQRSMVGSWA